MAIERSGVCELCRRQRPLDAHGLCDRCREDLIDQAIAQDDAAIDSCCCYLPAGVIAGLFLLALFQWLGWR